MCKILLFKNKNLITKDTFTYEINGDVILIVDNALDLGVSVDSNCTFRTHVSLVKTASKRLINMF